MGIRGGSRMNTKEAIEFIEEIKKYFDCVCNYKGDATIDLLKCGEKYEQMWEELERGHEAIKEDEAEERWLFKKEMVDIKQKYFPEPEKIDWEERLDKLFKFIRETYNIYDPGMAYAYNLGYIDALTDYTHGFTYDELNNLTTLNDQLRVGG